jgi:hypothetical protein
MSYADIAKVDNLDKVVEELMKEQHKDMLRKLKAGEFDGVIERFKAGKKVTPLLTEEVSVEPPQAAVVPSPAPVAAVPPQAVVASKPEPRQVVPTVAKPPAAPTLPGPEASSSKVEIGLDDVILSYLLGDDKEPGPRR